MKINKILCFLFIHRDGAVTLKKAPSMSLEHIIGKTNLLITWRAFIVRFSHQCHWFQLILKYIAHIFVPMVCTSTYESSHGWAKGYDGARMFTSLLLNMTSSLLHSFFEKVIMVILTGPPPLPSYVCASFHFKYSLQVIIISEFCSGKFVIGNEKLFRLCCSIIYWSILFKVRM